MHVIASARALEVFFIFCFSVLEVGQRLNGDFLFLFPFIFAWIRLPIYCNTLIEEDEIRGALKKRERVFLQTIG